MDIVGNLPVELGQKILMYLNPKDLFNALKCCYKWKQITESEYFWKKKMEIDLDVLEEHNLDTPNFKNFVQKFSNIWEAKYMFGHKLESRWKRVSYCHRQFSLPWRINLLVYMDDQILMVAVNCFAIAIINIIDGTVAHLFLAEKLFFAEKCDNFLYAFGKGGRNEKVLFKVWDLKTKKQICNIQTELFPQCCSKSFYKHLIAYVPVDQQLHIFNINTGKLEYCKDNIFSVHCSKDFIAMGSRNGVIEILDLNYKPLMTLRCCSSSYVSDIDIHKDYLAIICTPRKTTRDSGIYSLSYQEKGVACVWNLKTQTKLWTMKPCAENFLDFAKDKKLLCTKLENYAFFNLLVGNAFRRSIEVFNAQHRLSYFISNGRYIFMGDGSTSEVTMLCPKTHRYINKLDLTVDFKFKRLLDRPCFFPLVSKSKFAYISDNQTHLVVILDFGFMPK